VSGEAKPPISRTTIAAGLIAVLGLVLVVFALLAGVASLFHTAAPAAVAPAAPAAVPAAAGAEPPAEQAETADHAAPGGETDGDQGFLYGRVTTSTGGAYEGRLRWGKGDQEAFWGDYFNGTKEKNVWVEYLAPGQVPRERFSFRIFGLDIHHGDRELDLDRMFMTRFGDIARIVAGLNEIRVTLKSGAEFVLNRQAASDIDDGLRVWDKTRGLVDVDWVHTIEFLPTPGLEDVPGRLHGTVHTQHGDFTGFVQWDRQECIGSDELDGRTDTGDLSLRFETIRSIARRPDASVLVTQVDGREVALHGTNDVGPDNRGIYVDDPRYGRVLVPWNAFERLDVVPDGTGPGYGEYPKGGPLRGSVTTHDGHRHTGRLVYDLDEGETTETLDAPSQGVDYTIPFGLIATIVPAGPEAGRVSCARVVLGSGEELALERKGDLGERNAGLLVFAGGSDHPEYIPWNDVAQVDFDRPPATFPPFGERE